jgi:hypothetical protein
LLKIKYIFSLALTSSSSSQERRTSPYLGEVFFALHQPRITLEVFFIPHC